MMKAATMILSIEQLQRLTRRSGDDVVSGISSSSFDNNLELWLCLIETVQSPTVSDKHMTAACNGICFVLRANASGSDEELRKQAYSSDTWRQTFAAAHAAFASGKNKPAIQVLQTLQFLAETNSDRECVVMNVEESATEVVGIVLGQDPKRFLKEACIVLYFFLRKLSIFMSFSNVLRRTLDRKCAPFSQLCHISGVSTGALENEAHPPWLAFVLALLFAVRVNESKSAALKLLALLCELPSSIYQVDLPITISKSIDIYGAADQTSLEAVTRDVLPSLLTNRSLYLSFLDLQAGTKILDTSAVLVVLTLLQYGKSKRFLDEKDIPALVSKFCFGMDSQILPNNQFEVLGLLLSHSSPSIRLRSCEVLVSSPSPSTPFPQDALPCLLANLAHVHNETDAFQRSELFSIFRRFVTRLQQSHRTLSSQTNGERDRALLEQYDEFYLQYVSFLEGEIVAGNSYPRHVLALQLLDLMSENLQFHNNRFRDIIFSDHGLLKNLWRLLTDPYEDIRHLSYVILFKAASDSSQTFHDVIVSLDPMAISTLASTTNRADHADAFGRALCLVHDETLGLNRVHGNDSIHSNLDRLVTGLVTHVTSLRQFNVADSIPLHGTILGITYMIERLSKSDVTISESSSRQVLDTCHRIWSLSFSHLCVDSPEFETEPLENVTSGPKDQLAYAWRALRDANLLMQAVLENCDSSRTLIEQIGNITLDQLRSLRHRGAFSAVAQTFTLCCNKARNSNESETRALVDVWFTEAMEELDRQAAKLTRRSAGLPAIFAAILNPSDKQKFWDSFQALIRIAEQPPVVEHGETESKLRLPQVHALNCIKDIMTSSRFRTMTEPLVTLTLNLSAVCMSSNIWAIKNCGLMLLRASINRLDPDTSLGNAEAGMNFRTLFDTDRSPSDLAIELLGGQKDELKQVNGQEPVSEIDQAFTGSPEAVFAGLDLLGRLYIKEDEKKMVTNLVMEKVGHPLWHIRAQAARLLVSMIPQGLELSTLRSIVSEYESNPITQPNYAHGVMMVVNNLVQRIRLSANISELDTEIVRSLSDLSTSGSIMSYSSSLSIWLSLSNQVMQNRQTGNTWPIFLLDALDRATGFIEKCDQKDTLLDREVAIFHLCRSELAQESPKFSIADAFQHDDDVVIYALEIFKPRSNKHSVESYFNFLIDLMQQTTATMVRAAILQAFTDNILSSDTSIDAAKLLNVMQHANIDGDCSRTLLEHSIVFHAALCRSVWTQKHMAALNQLKLSTANLALCLRNACDDEVEFDTRHSSVKALQQWSTLPDIHDMLDAMFDPTTKLEIFLVLYDLLNDDDEDIRGEASGFAEVLLTRLSESCGIGQAPFCAVASRQKLLEHMKTQFPDAKSFLLEALRRVLNINSIGSRSKLDEKILAYLDLRNVESQVAKVLDATNDLFAEEKQNLYVDSIAELRIWSKMVEEMAQRHDISTVIDKLSAWASDGVEVFNAILFGQHPLSSYLLGAEPLSLEETQDAGNSTNLKPKVMFGTSFTQDLELLMMRVVVVMRLSGNANSVAMWKLYERCVCLNVSQTLSSAFNVLT